MPGTLGLGPAAESLYRAMIRHPGVGVAELAIELQLTAAQVREGLDELSRLALVTPADDGSRLQPLPPEKAMELLLANQQADLIAQQLRIERSRAAAAELIAEWSSVRGREPDVDVERLVGLGEIRDRLARLAREAEEEIMTFAPGGGHDEDDLRASRGPNAEMLDRGLRLRTIYLDSVRNDPPTLEHVTWLEERGARVRTTASLPLRMVIVDRAAAVLPVDMEDARVGAVVLKGASTVTALCALFESVWQAATPFGGAQPPDPDGLSPQERAALLFLAQGHTDESIAKRLGVSARTARRLAADLMGRLGARSRFQAGVIAAQRGWLPECE
jgi:DNA-binding CsgD family transcriptional regulator